MAPRRVDLSDAEVVDNHCHGFRVAELLAKDPSELETRLTLMGMCFESSRSANPSMWSDVVRSTDSTVYALAARRWLAERLGCDAASEEVAQARRRAIEPDPSAYIRALLEDQRITALVADEGYPLPRIPAAEFSDAVGGVPVHRVVRIEPIIAELRQEARDFAELEERFVAALDEAAADPNTVAFKSIIAYRTGLDVRRTTRDDAWSAFVRWQADGFAEQSLHSKPVRDYLLERTLAVAKRADRVMHIHTGDGDPDVVFERAQPKYLMPLLRDHVDQPIVLIHAGHPWSHEAGYLASLLPNVYVDLSVLLPWASSAVDQLLSALIGMAPTSKLLYSSDQASEPEVFWLSARMARTSLERVLSDAVERDFLTPEEGERAGRAILAENTRRLHALSA